MHARARTGTLFRVLLIAGVAVRAVSRACLSVSAHLDSVYAQRQPQRRVYVCVCVCVEDSLHRYFVQKLWRCVRVLLGDAQSEGCKRMLLHGIQGECAHAIAGVWTHVVMHTCRVQLKAVMGGVVMKQEKTAFATIQQNQAYAHQTRCAPDTPKQGNAIGP